MPRQWTDQQRAAQAERCRKQQPWKHSTGPKSVAGKRKVAQNSRKPASLELANAIRAESWRRYDEGDYDGYRQLSHLAVLVGRRVRRRFRGRSRIKPWTPPKRERQEIVRTG
ncbi:MAG: hypothetical protein ACYSUP_15745 [Planctomycetota bacterium]|jgi:hypothetical protein